MTTSNGVRNTVFGETVNISKPRQSVLMCTGKSSNCAHVHPDMSEGSRTLRGPNGSHCVLLAAGGAGISGGVVGVASEPDTLRGAAVAAVTDLEEDVRQDPGPAEHGEELERFVRVEDLREQPRARPAVTRTDRLIDRERATARRVGGQRRRCGGGRGRRRGADDCGCGRMRRAGRRR